MAAGANGGSAAERSRKSHRLITESCRTYARARKGPRRSPRTAMNGLSHGPIPPFQIYGPGGAPICHILQPRGFELTNSDS